MHKLQQMMRHPAGRVGLSAGLAIGLIAAMMGQASKALLFAGICRLLARQSSQR